MGDVTNTPVPILLEAREISAITFHACAPCNLREKLKFTRRNYSPGPTHSHVSHLFLGVIATSTTNAVGGGGGGGGGGETVQHD